MRFVYRSAEIRCCQSRYKRKGQMRDVLIVLRETAKRGYHWIKMRNIIILCTILLTVCLLSEVQGSCPFEGQQLTVGVHYIKCKEYRCHEDGHVSGLACPLYQCAEGKQIGYREEDLGKPYPECCAGPICKE